MKVCKVTASEGMLFNTDKENGIATYCFNISNAEEGIEEEQGQITISCKKFDEASKKFVDDKEKMVRAEEIAEFFGFKLFELLDPTSAGIDQDIFDKSYEMYAIFDEETGNANLYTYEPTLRLRKDKIDRDTEKAINNLKMPVVCSAVQRNQWIDWEAKNQYGSTGQIDFFVDVEVDGKIKHVRVSGISYYAGKDKKRVYLNYLPKSRKNKNKRDIDDSIAEMLDVDLSDAMLERKKQMIQKMVEGRYKRLLVEIKEKLGWDIAGMIEGTTPLPVIDQLRSVDNPNGDGVYLQADITPVEE